MDPIAANQSIEDLIEQYLFQEDQLHERNSTGTRACNYVQNPKEHECGSSEMSDTLKSNLTQQQGKRHPEEPFLLDESDQVETAIRNCMSRNGRVTFICEVCKSVFLSRLGLRIHMSKTHFKIGPYGCEVCKKKFFAKYDLDAHLCVHTGKAQERNGTEYKFPFCGKSYTRNFYLKRHQMRHHPEEGLPLDETDQVEIAKRNWKSQIGRVAFTCEVCKIVFLSRLGLRIHMSKMHFKIGPYGCEVCKKKFFTKYDLDVHLCVHTGKAQEENGI